MLSWLGSFEPWLENYIFPEHKNPTEEIFNAYDIAKRYGMSSNTMYNYIRIFNNSINLKYLKPIKGARKTVHKLLESDWTLISLSSYSDSKLIHSLRHSNLEEVFHHDDFDYVFSKYHDLPLGSDKYEVLEKYKDEDLCIFIDDSPKHVAEAISLGIEAHLLLAPYNENHELAKDYGITWEDIYNVYAK